LQKVSLNPVFDPLRLASVAMDIAVVGQAAPADIARRQATRIGEPYLGRYVVWESSGTGGQPGVFVQNGAAMAVYDAL